MALPYPCDYGTARATLLVHHTRGMAIYSA
jgi:hypothetical protein